MFRNDHDDRIRIYSTGCSTFGCLTMFLFVFLILRGGWYLLSRYFWLIVILSFVTYLFRRWGADQVNQKEKNMDINSSFENSKEGGKVETSKTIQRDFEEIDE